MGNWRNRPPRRFNRQRNPWTSYSYDSELPSEPLQDNVPQWEKKFCYVIGSVPWRKVVNTKKFMPCHTSVLDWDDSAVKETFQNAKKRFWSEMNGFHCEAPMPDPDIYIDEIDWNPDIDPELLSELDREFFAPVDEREGRDDRVLRRNKKTRNSVSAPSDGSHGNQACDANNALQVDGCVSESKEVEALTGNGVVENDGWGCHENKSSDCVETGWESNENPWERGNPSSVSWKGNNGWGEWNNCIKVSSNVEAKPSTGNSLVENDSWGCHDSKRETSWENNENPWERGNPSSVSWKGNNGWGNSCDKDWDWSRDEWNNTVNNKNNNNNLWAQSSSQVQRSREQGCGGRHWGSYSNNNRNFDFRGRGGGRWGPPNEGNNNWRRDDYRRDSSSYRNSRYRGDSNQASDPWITRGNNRKRVSFE